MRHAVSLMVLAIVLAAVPVLAQSDSPRAIVDDYVKAWNGHNGDMFAHIFKTDAVFVRFAESRLEGRSRIVAEYSKILSTWAKDVDIYASSVVVRTLDSNAAVLLFHLGHLENGTQSPRVDVAMLLVAVKRSDGWWVDSGQMTHPLPPA